MMTQLATERNRGAATSGQVLLLFMTLLTCYVYFFPRWADWNQNSRLDLVQALVDDHTLAIDKYVGNTGDYASVGGHAYSDKAPGLALLGVPVYAAFRSVVPIKSTSLAQVAVANNKASNSTLRKGGLGLDSERLYTFAALIVTTFVTVTIPSIVAAVILFLLSVQLGLRQRQSLVITGLYALATIAFPYSNSFVSHQFSASLLLAAFAILFGIRRNALGRFWIVIAGFLLGYAVISEFPTALIGAILGIYALRSLGNPRGTLVRLLVGAMPAVVLLAVLDYIAFGTPLPVGYLHSALFPGQIHTGFFSVAIPQLGALWGITFSPYRGLFFLSPYLLFFGLGYVILWRLREYRPEFWVLLAAPIAFFLFNMSTALWDGGFAVGPRYVVASLPFLALVSGRGLVEAWQRPIWRLPIAVASAWSFFAVWAETIGGQSFPDYTSNPLFDFSLPQLAAGDIARNAGMVLGLSGWASVIPLFGVMVLVVTYMIHAISSERPDNTPKRLAPEPSPGENN